MEGYNVAIKETSRELSARERVMIKDTSNAQKIDHLVNENPLVITPVWYAVLQIHNERSTNKDYEVYIIVDKNGTKFSTGSPSFWESFSSITAEMQGEEEEYSIECYKLPSKNYTDKTFLTCSIV